MTGSTARAVLHWTYASCPLCLLKEHRPMKFLVSSIDHEENSIFLTVHCSRHQAGEQFPRILLSSSASMYHHMLSFGTPSSVFLSRDDLPPVTEFLAKCQYPCDPPLITEVPIVDTANAVLHDDLLESNLAEAIALMAKTIERRTALRVSCRLCTQMRQLNAAIMKIVGLLPAQIAAVLVEGSFDRISVLSRFLDSCFLSGRVFPCIRLYVAPQAEEQAVKELAEAVSFLSAIRDIQITVCLVCSPAGPPAQLAKVIGFLRGLPGLVRTIIVSMERSPSEIMKSVISWDGKKPFQASADMFPLCRNLSNAIGSSFQPTDFLPVGSLTVVEPLLPAFGYPWYCFNHHFWQDFATVLVTSQCVQSVPLSRLFQTMDLFDQLKRLNISASEDGKHNVGFMKIRAIKKILKGSRTAEAVKQGWVADDLISYLTDSKNEAIAVETVKQCQVVMLQIGMDVGCIDLVKRAYSSELTLRTETEDKKGSQWVAGSVGLV